MGKFVLIKRIKKSTVMITLLSLAILLAIYPVWQWADKKMLETTSWVVANRTIAIDAGHGGPDPGACGHSGSLEKDINLEIAKKVEGYLIEAGANVVMTRTDDSTFSAVKKDDLDARTKLVEDNNSQIFVSIQCNSLPDERWRGFQVFYHPSSEKGQILAKSVEKKLVKVLDNSDRKALPHKAAYILKSLAIPAIIVETGFISNPEEEKLLLDESYQNKVAYGIYAGIINYLVENQ